MMGTFYSPSSAFRLLLVPFVFLFAFNLSSQTLDWYYLHDSKSNGQQLGRLSDGNIFVVGNDPEDSLSIKVFSDGHLISNIGLPGYFFEYVYIGLYPDSNSLIMLESSGKLIRVNPYTGEASIIFDFGNLESSDLRIIFYGRNKDGLLFKVSPRQNSSFHPYYVVINERDFTFSRPKVQVKSSSYILRGFYSNGDWLFSEYDHGIKKLKFHRIDHSDNEVAKGEIYFNDFNHSSYSFHIDTRDNLFIFGDTVLSRNRFHKAFVKVLDVNFLISRSVIFEPDSVDLQYGTLFVPRRIFEAKDGGYLLYGDGMAVISYKDFPAWFVKLDNLLIKKWEYKFHLQDLSCSASGVLEAENDFWIATGHCVRTEWLIESRLFLLNLKGLETSTSNESSGKFLITTMPVSDVLRLNKPMDFHSKYSVWDLQGRRLMDGTWSGEADVSGLAPGMYQFILHQEGQPLVFRFIKV